MKQFYLDCFIGALFTILIMGSLVIISFGFCFLAQMLFSMLIG